MNQRKSIFLKGTALSMGMTMMLAGQSANFRHGDLKVSATKRCLVGASAINCWWCKHKALFLQYLTGEFEVTDHGWF
jgi:hypothetical protein